MTVECKAGANNNDNSSSDVPENQLMTTSAAKTNRQFLEKNLCKNKAKSHERSTTIPQLTKAADNVFSMPEPPAICVPKISTISVAPNKKSR